MAEILEIFDIGEKTYTVVVFFVWGSMGGLWILLFGSVCVLFFRLAGLHAFYKNYICYKVKIYAYI